MDYNCCYYNICNRAGKGASVQPYKFGGKELDAMYGLNIYDFHARTQTPDLARFTRPDPLAEKTPHLSPYLFCANDPVNNTDPTGMEVKFPQDKRSMSFNIKLNEVRKYLGADYTKVYNSMKDSKHVFIIQDGNSNGLHFKTKTHMPDENGIMEVEISIDLSNAIELENGEIVSSALGALHEFGHGAKIADDEIGYFEGVSINIPVYDNEEEKRNLSEVERPAAERLGEPIRADHKYNRFIDNKNDPTMHKTNENEIYF